MTLGTRAAALARITAGEHWDLVVVGGGITGAGVLREAARRGLKVLLLEQQDFAWGTSSRSSKMVHGGLRYIALGDFRLTREALQERERLLVEAPGLVARMGYIFPVRSGQFPGRWSFTALLALYDRFAGIRDHRWLDRAALLARVPGLQEGALKGACYYTDAVTDDARLVLRTLQEGVADGGVVANYLRVVSLRRDGDRVRGVVVEDLANGARHEVDADAVISATGAWADRLRGELVSEKRIRPLRGSHLVLPRARLPVDDALTLLHPRDRRPVFVFPWEGMTVVGTTDLDHRDDLDIEAAISREEVEYLYDAVASQFGGARLTDADVVSTWAGVRPVIGSEQHKDPSKERRDHAVWADGGLVTVSGGKLTTYRLIALDALRAARQYLAREVDLRDDGGRIFAPAAAVPAHIPAQRAAALAGRYGHAVAAYAQLPGAGEPGIAGTPWNFADIDWVLAQEQVQHLDDLLLRRTRLGNLLPGGGDEALLADIGARCRAALGWDDARWRQELARYRGIWQRYYALPGGAHG